MKLSVINGDTASINLDTASINLDTASINAEFMESINAEGFADGSSAVINGCPCQSFNGIWWPETINGIAIEPKPADVTREEYENYLLARSLGDKTALSVNGLRDWIKKVREKGAARREEKRARKRTKRAQRAERKKASNNLFGAIADRLRASGSGDGADMLDELDRRGIEPDDNTLSDMLSDRLRDAGRKMGEGAKSSFTDGPLLPIGIGIAALIFLSKSKRK